uniref:Retinol binding protein 7b, cellular n=1 Tax=Callorhinchus milii TaxID=7868 RepID=A0A4W3H6X2_CALMI
MTDIDFPTRKIANLLKPQKVIEQKGDSFIVKTLSTFRNYRVQFTVGEEFEEDTKGLDNRKCKSLVTWVSNKLVCVQKGEKENRGWTHWVEDGDLHLVFLFNLILAKCFQVFQQHITFIWRLSRCKDVSRRCSAKICTRAGDWNQGGRRMGESGEWECG